MRKRDVLAFGARLEDNLFLLHAQLRADAYVHDQYEHFYVHDPKRRYISKASVKDRIVHQAVTQVLEPIFERTFIFDSFAARKGKGVHAAVDRFELFLRQASRNYQHPVYVLKGDIRKFYDSVRHDLLLRCLQRVLHNDPVSRLVSQILKSYATDLNETCGLPLGNVTSQLLTNVYLNGFDHFVKETLRARWYIRFCDDFVIVHQKRDVLENVVLRLRAFLHERRALTLHPQKTSIRKLTHGVDFVGQVLRPHYRILRTRTKRRLARRMHMLVAGYCAGRIAPEDLRQSLQSCLGALSHGSNITVRERLKEMVMVKIMQNNDRKSVGGNGAPAGA